MLTAYEMRAEFYLVIERVTAASPHVSARKQHMIESLMREVNAMLAERKKPDPSAAIIADAQTGTAFALIRAAIRAWVAANGSRSLVGFFDEAVNAVRFVEPKASTPRP